MSNVNQDKITHYLTLRNKADMEIEATGWVSEETDDALEVKVGDHCDRPFVCNVVFN